MTAAQSLNAILKERGLTRKQVAKKARIGEPYLMSLWRQGKAPLIVAATLGEILGVSPTVFLWGYAHYTEHFQGQ